MTDQRNNETDVEFQNRKAEELAVATNRHVANALAWATMAIHGPEQYKAARYEMFVYELGKAGVV